MAKAQATRVPFLVLTQKVQLMLRYAAQTTPDLEVGGLAKCSLVESATGQDFILSDVRIPPQEVMGAQTEITGDTIYAMMSGLAAKGEVLADWRCWWHSHGNMGSNRSGTDVDTLALFARELGDYAVGLVINSRDEAFTSWVSVRTPFEFDFDIPVIREQAENTRLRKQVSEMMAEVRRKVVVQKAPKHYVAPGWPASTQYVRRDGALAAPAQAPAASAEASSHHAWSRILTRKEKRSLVRICKKMMAEHPEQADEHVASLNRLLGYDRAEILTAEGAFDLLDKDAPCLCTAHGRPNCVALHCTTERQESLLPVGISEEEAAAWAAYWYSD